MSNKRLEAIEVLKKHRKKTEDKFVYHYNFYAHKGQSEAGRKAVEPFKKELKGFDLAIKALEGLTEERMLSILWGLIFSSITDHDGRTNILLTRTSRSVSDLAKAIITEILREKK